jgi:hypothetical protein
MNKSNSVGQLICLAMMLDIGPLSLSYFVGDEPITAAELNELISLSLVNKNAAKKQYDINNIGKIHIETLLKQPVC